MRSSAYQISRLSRSSSPHVCRFLCQDLPGARNALTSCSNSDRAILNARGGCSNESAVTVRPVRVPSELRAFSGIRYVMYCQIAIVDEILLIRSGRTATGVGAIE